MNKEIGLKKGNVKIENYDPEWQEEFAKEKKNLEELFNNVAESIEHVGSTSVVGLPAKPIIDIAVGVRSLEDIGLVKEKILELPHYSIKEDNADGEILMRRGSPIKAGEVKPDFITHFIHIMEIHGKKYKETLAYRDYLRSHSEAIKEYGKLKQELAVIYKNDRKSYTKAKEEFITCILNKCDLN